MVMTSRGRKQGSPNRLTLQSKTQIAQAVLPHIEKTLRGINALDPKQRLDVLIKFFPYFLEKGKVSAQETEVQMLLEKHLLPHYDKIGIYFGHLDEKEKAKVLLKLLSYFSPKQNSKIAPKISQKLKLPIKSI